MMSISRKKAYYCCLVLATALTGRSYAQYENVWIFGRNAGVDFNGSSPVAITSNTGPATQANGEAGASVCDAGGNLLFYTEGYRAYDRQYNLMPDGSRLTPMGGVTSYTPTSGAAQGTVIVPVPGRPERYYIFSLTSYDQYPARNNGKLFYSVVDMTLNNGLGDVVFGRKAIPLDTGLSEAMTAVAGEDCNIWLLTISRYGKLKAFGITARGVNHTPVLSDITNMGPTLVNGCMDVSPDRRMIAFTQQQLLPVNHKYGLTLLDFDPATGMASNERPLVTDGNGYGVCFSPDNTRLYFNQITITTTQSMLPLGLYQFDVSSGNLANILASRTQVLYTGREVFQLKRAPDGKIYFGSFGTSPGNTALSVIDLPNQPGMACQPVPGALPLIPGTSCGPGLPNVVPPFIPVDTIASKEIIKTCETRVTFAPRDTAGLDYVWNDGFTGTSRTADSPGTYWVSYYAAPPCAYHTDTFEVALFRSDSSSLSRTICTYETFDFNGRQLSSSGTYRDTLTTAGGCDSFVTLNLVVLPSPEVSLSTGQSTDWCIGDTILYAAAGADHYLWFSNGRLLADSGNAARIHLSELSNRIMVIGLSENDCLDTTAAVIHAEVCCDMFVPNAFSPNNDGINDGFVPVSQKHIRDYHLQIFNRWGQLVFSASDAGKRWDGNFNGAPAEVGSYFYYITAECPEGNKPLVRKGDITLIR